MDSSDEEDVQSFFGIGRNYLVRPKEAPTVLESDDDVFHSDIDTHSSQADHKGTEPNFVQPHINETSNSIGDMESTYNVKQDEKDLSTFGDLANKKSNSSTVKADKESSHATSTEEEPGVLNRSGNTRKRFVLQNRKN